MSVTDRQIPFDREFLRIAETYARSRKYEIEAGCRKEMHAFFSSCTLAFVLDKRPWTSKMEDVEGNIGLLIELMIEAARAEGNDVLREPSFRTACDRLRTFSPIFPFANKV